MAGKSVAGKAAAGNAAPKSAAKTAKVVVSIPQLGWDRIRPAQVVLVSGTEDFLAERAIRMLREILRAEDPSLEISDLGADDYGPGELITLASPSLFGEPRLIRVSGVEKCTDAFIFGTWNYRPMTPMLCCGTAAGCAARSCSTQFAGDSAMASRSSAPS
jgi:DNA polymerase-3 subunit delta